MWSQQAGTGIVALHYWCRARTAGMLSCSATRPRQARKQTFPTKTGGWFSDCGIRISHCNNSCPPLKVKSAKLSNLL